MPDTETGAVRVEDLNPAFGVRVASAEKCRAAFERHADMAADMAGQAIIEAKAGGDPDTDAAAYESAASVHAMIAAAAACADPYAGERTGTIHKETLDAADR